MCEKCGMLFIYSESDFQSFWMKNTLIPLDMIFFEENWEIVDIREDMRPESETEEPMRYTSSEKALYVLEVNGGFVEEF